MKLDNENQRKMLIQLIAAATFQGAAVKEVAKLLHEVETAEIDVKAVEACGAG